jgi:hypothetical protein
MTHDESRAALARLPRVTDRKQAADLDSDQQRVMFWLTEGGDSMAVFLTTT